MNQREQIIRNYINAYNNFDIDGMVANFDDAIKFENISNGNVIITIAGLNDFKKKAEQAKHLFTKRKQTIKRFTHHHDYTEIEIDYNAVLAIDLSKALKTGDELNLERKSIFKFSENKIIELTDVS